MNMSKIRLGPELIIGMINQRIRLTRGDAASGSACRIETLKPAVADISNVTVDTMSFSGVNLTHVPECEKLVNRILLDFAVSHEVAWETEASPRM